MGRTKEIVPRSEIVDPSLSINGNSIITEDTIRQHYPNFLGCYDLSLELEDNAFQDAVIAKIIACLRSDTLVSELLPSKSHQQLFVSLLTALLLKNMATEYGPDSSLWKLSVPAAAQWGTEKQVEVMMGTGSEQLRVDVEKHLVGLRKVMDPGEFTPSPGSTIKKIPEVFPGWDNERADDSDGEGANVWGS